MFSRYTQVWSLGFFFPYEYLLQKYSIYSSLRAQKLLTDLVQRPGSTAAFPGRAPAPGLAGASTDAGLPCEGQGAISTPRQAPLNRSLPDGRGGGDGFPAPPAWPRRSGTAMAAAPELRESLAQRLRDLGIATVTAEHPQVRAATTAAAAVSPCGPWRCPGPFRGGWAGSGPPRWLSAPSGSFLNPAIKFYAPTGQSRLRGSFVPYARFFRMISYQYGISHQMDLQGLGLAGNIWGFLGNSERRRRVASPPRSCPPDPLFPSSSRSCGPSTFSPQSHQPVRCFPNFFSLQLKVHTPHLSSLSVVELQKGMLSGLPFSSVILLLYTSDRDDSDSVQEQYVTFYSCF